MTTTTPDLTDYRVIHECLRIAPHRLGAALTAFEDGAEGQAKALVRYWAGYAGEVLAHHTIEDDIFFPALVERVPLASEHLGRVDDEHHRLDDLMEEAAADMQRLADAPTVAVAMDAAAAVRELARLMDGHLDFEDDDLVPLFGRHFSAAEYEAMHQQAAKSLGLGRQAAFTVPFIVHWADPDDIAKLMGDAPLPFRVLYRLSRRSHERLTARALRAAADREAVLV
jgi:hemerythrin-like domain-containing protein